MKYNIDRFVQMHKMYYPDALKEIKNGYKMTHWMWYIFPQLKGLGHSYKAEYYGLDGVEEAIEYIKNEYLKNNMLEICSELIKVDDDIKYIFGYPDYLKLNSSMTLFDYALPNEKVFKSVIDKFYDGKKDEMTLSLLKKK